MTRRGIELRTDGSHRRPLRRHHIHLYIGGPAPATAAAAVVAAEETAEVVRGGLHEHTMRAGVSMCTRVGARAGRAWFEG